MKPVLTRTHAFPTLDAATSILLSGSDWVIGLAYVSYDWFKFMVLSLSTPNLSALTPYSPFSATNPSTLRSSLALLEHSPSYILHKKLVPLFTS